MQISIMHLLINNKFVDIVSIIEYNVLITEVSDMEYLTATELSVIWNISTRRIGVLCTEGRIEGAVKKGKMWLIPESAQKSADARYKKKRLKNNVVGGNQGRKKYSAICIYRWNGR